jgi:hypothetical protein
LRAHAQNCPAPYIYTLKHTNIDKNIITRPQFEVDTGFDPSVRQLCQRILPIAANMSVLREWCARGERMACVHAHIDAVECAPVVYGKCTLALAIELGQLIRVTWPMDVFSPLQTQFNEAIQVFTKKLI